MLESFIYCKIIADKNGEPIDWVFLDVNESYENLSGIQEEDIIGKKVTEVFPNEPKDPSDWIGKYGRVAITGEPARFESFRQSLGKWLNVSAYSPKKGYFVSIFEDITERKKAEDSLRNTERLLSAVTDGSSDAIYVKDRQSHWLFVNPALERITGKPSSELLGKNDLEIYANHEIGKAMMANDRRIIDSGKSETLEETVEAPDGQHHFISEKVPRFDDKGQVIGLIGISRDITERKKAEEQLAAYSKNLESLVEQRTKQLKDAERLAAIGATAGMVGHDIRNPLQAMMSDAYLLKDELTSMPECKTKEGVIESIDSIEKNITYINKIVADLQDYARPLKPELSEVNLYELVISVFAPIAIPDNLKPSIEIDPNLKLKSDPTLVRRVLGNLIINAIQAMPNGGKLIIRAFKNDDEATIEVTDTGVGIPDDVKPKLFTPMMTTKAKGQGLGLAVVKRLVESLNGTISFESQEGKGTKFIVEIPLNK